MILINEPRLKISITDGIFISRGSDATPVQYLILLIIPSVFKILLPKFVVQSMYCFHLVFSAILGKMSCQLKEA